MKIRIAQISTSDQGGAAIAAMRLSKLLVSNGLDSTFITRSNGIDFKYPGVKSSSHLVFGKLVTKMQYFNSKQAYGVVTPLSISNIDIHKLLKNRYDIVHIHNWYNFLSLQDIQILSERVPIVFTVHDERLITGGCHTTLECKKYMEGCIQCPAIHFGKHLIEISKSKMDDFFLSSQNLSLISPSQWIIEQISAIYSDKKFASISHIPNMIPLQLSSHLLSRDSERNRLRLLFVSADLAAPVKGLSLLLQALAMLEMVLETKLNSKIELHLVGRGSIPNNLKTTAIISHGYLSSDDLNSLMLTNDFLVVPSYSENSSNVISEAQILGLPVLASNIKGNSEQIIDGVTGFLFALRPDDLVETLMKAFQSKDIPEIRMRAQMTSKLRHDEASIIQSHLEVYEKAVFHR
jgi:glycosyltransferase involved in cell wall biosynthesis